MAAQASWFGKPLTIQACADGRSFFLPKFAEEAGVNAAELWDIVSDKGLYQPRGADHMKFRGKPLPRSKCFLDFSADRSVLRKYTYPGFQWKAMQFYRRGAEVPAVAEFVTDMTAGLRIILQDGKEAPAVCVTQGIVTMYDTGSDAINWHADKKKDIRDGGWIVDLSLGATRTLELKPAAAKKASQSIPLPSGSLFLLSTETNDTWHHRITKERKGRRVAARASIVFRDITTAVPVAKLMKKLAAGGKKK
jgi:alkylated DNA repair dioxygenase AlkB